MTKDYKIVNGIRFAKDVDTSRIDWDAPIDPEVEAELQKPVKIRITTMVDEDVYEALKQGSRARDEGHYQTYLNRILRQALLLESPGASGAFRFEVTRQITEVEERVAAIEAKLKQSGTKKVKRARS